MRQLLARSSGAPLIAVIVPPKYSDVSAMIEIDRLRRFHHVGHRSRNRRRRRRRLDIQKLGPVAARKLGVATATRRCAAVSTETVAPNIRRSNFLGVAATRVG